MLNNTALFILEIHLSTCVCQIENILDRYLTSSNLFTHNYAALNFKSLAHSSFLLFYHKRLTAAFPDAGKTQSEMRSSGIFLESYQ